MMETSNRQFIQETKSHTVRLNKKCTEHRNEKKKGEQNERTDEFILKA